MHTATRLAIDAAAVVRSLAPAMRICFYGLYGQANAEHLVAAGADAVISGEYEAELLAYVGTTLGSAIPDGRMLSLVDRLEFKVPDRAGLPALENYAQLAIGEERRVVGYTESTRGCRHLCRHCPVAPVYGGRVRVVGLDVVLADLEAQVAAGAQHISFGDPDFFNASAHGIRVVQALHERWPDLTYDVTIKVEHLLKHRDLLPVLARTGCLFVTSAVEAVDDRILERLEKGHTRADFETAVGLCRDAGLVLVPTFVAFTPWTTIESYEDLLSTVATLDLVEHVAPVQWAIRLMVTHGSRLLELDDLARDLGPFDPHTLTYPWTHSDPRVDALQREIMGIVGVRQGATRAEIFERVWTAAAMAGARDTAPPKPRRAAIDRATIPYLDEPWYC
jgi:radical SAM superfamily enzyme YgiQ (UPF0313 family)